MNYMEKALEAYIGGDTAKALQLVDEAEGEYQFSESELAELAELISPRIDTSNSPEYTT